MDDTNIEKIKNNITNNFSKIDTNTLLLKIKNSSSVIECESIFNEFIESFNEMKSNIILSISEELNQIKNNIEEKEISNNIINSEIKTIISQNKLKIKNISSNINDIYSSINLVNSNIEKKKYSLASSRISKIISIKNTIISNIKQLETSQQKILDEISFDKKNKKGKNNSSNNTIKVKPAPTPFPISFFNLSNNNNKRTIKKTESTNKKMINKRRRDFSFSLRENTINNTRNTSVNNYTLSAYNTINNFHKNENKNEDELNKKLINQKKINDKLKIEIQKLKEKINKADISNNEQLNNNKYYNNFKEKINNVSDLVFSLTFLFNGLQNKINKENEKDFSDIKKNLLEITTEISEIKSLLLKISLDNSENNVQTSLSSSGLIKSTNQSINITEELYNNNNNIPENKINSLLISTQSNNSDASEILTLKEKLQITEKKLMELKSIYESDIESRNLIEKLLKQNLEENKVSYEQKILKYKKRYEEKEKEITEIKKKFEEEEMNILNKIKIDNEENIKKLRNIYELKNNNKFFSNLQEEKGMNIIIINECESKLDVIKKEKKNLEILYEKEKLEFRENNNKNMNKILELEKNILNYKSKENELNEEINNIKIENEKKIKILEQEIKTNQEKINELNNINNNNNEEIKKIKIEKEKLEKNLEEINNKLNKKDKEIITLITNNTKEKKNLIEKNKIEMENILKEKNDIIKINNNYKEQINIFQKKLIENKNNISITKTSDFYYLNKNSNLPLKNIYLPNREISLIIIPSIILSKKKSKNFINNDNTSIEDEEESDDFYDYENEENEEFIKKMKKINKKNKLDNEEMKRYRKENRKMISKLEDTFDEVEELKEKMNKIEKLVSEKQGQLYNNIKKYFSRILIDFNFNLNNDNKDNFIYFMKLIQFSDDEIKNIINSLNTNNNTKKKIQFNFFK